MEKELLKAQEIVDGAKEIADFYGIKHQAYQAIQEMAELIKELTDNINDGEDNLEEIEKETADVLVMALQLVHLYKMENLGIGIIKDTPIEVNFLKITI